MDLFNLNPFIRYARMHTNHISPNENRICYDCRLFYVLKGDGRLLADGKSYAVSQNTVVFLPSSTRYRFDFLHPDDVKIYVLNFDLTERFANITHSLGTANEADFDPDRVISASVSKELDEVTVSSAGLELENGVASCVELFISKTANYKHLASAHLKLALIEMINGKRLERVDYRLVQSVQDFVRLNYGDRTLSNKVVAETFSYHPYYLGRVMLRCTNMTLREYITDYRIRMAKNYLVTTPLSVTEIAGLCGFSSYTYFIKTFRERAGVSPLKYRKTRAVDAI